MQTNGVILEARYFHRAPDVKRAAAIRNGLRTIRELGYAGVRVDGRGRQVVLVAHTPEARRLACLTLESLEQVRQ